jgi:hypothetical protein
LAGTPKFWLAVGTPQNWHTAFDYSGIWGLKSSQRHYWEAIVENLDIVFFYATLPVGGVVGYGIVRTKLHQPSPLWPEERARNEVIWPLRFEFEPIACLPPSGWKNGRVITENLKARVRSGFQQVDESTARDLLKSLSPGKPADLVVTLPVGAKEVQSNWATHPESSNLDPHRHAQWLIAEIGRMQRFIADTEYPIETRRLDVVWRRVQRSVPSYAFEVQVGGNITEGVAKLKRAYELWNSNLFLVGREEHRRPLNELAATTFREIQDRMRFIELDQVNELYESKRAYREMERNLGILPYR